MKNLTFCFCIIAMAQLKSFAQELQLSLTASNFNGYNVSCFGGTNGSIDLSVTGGTPPYTYVWSDKPRTTTEDISNLSAGYYRVDVTDANSATAYADITLVQPIPFNFSLNAYSYGNGYNVSCFFCYDGIINTNVDGGVSPLTYQWNDGAVTANRSSIQAKSYQLVITDANGCLKEGGITLSAPSRDDWRMDGNPGTNPASNFLGTTDNKDFVFKTNNTERLRLKSSGELKAASLAGTGYRLMMADADGVVKPLDKAVAPNLIPWNTRGNDNIDDANDFIGPKNNKDFIIKTGDYYATPQTLKERLRVTKAGKVGIGTNNPSQALEIAHEDQYGGITINQVSTSYYTSEIKFNYQGAQKWATGCYLGSSNNQSYFIWNHGLTSPRTAFFIDGTNNNTGIDINAPTAKLDINGDIRVRALSGNGNKLLQVDNSGNISANSTNLSDLNLWQGVNSNDIYRATGNVFIGMSNCTGGCADPLYKLYVQGGIMARDVKVTATSPFPDYVFAKEYKLMSIYELEAYLQHNKHLPEMPTAKEIEQNQGYELGDMVTKLVKKVEEQTLYIIEQQKQIDELKNTMDKMYRR